MRKRFLTYVFAEGKELTPYLKVISNEELTDVVSTPAKPKDVDTKKVIVSRDVSLQ